MAACGEEAPRNLTGVIPQPTATTVQLLDPPVTLPPHVRVEGPAALANEVAYCRGITVGTGSESTGDVAVTLALDTAIAHPEGYVLRVLPQGVHIAGSTPAGVFYGVQTLRQLLPAGVEDGGGLREPVTLPAAEVVDHPRFPYRGMHLDVSRHFFPVDSVKAYIEMLAMHKLNRFHWHLTDDQGWRIEIKAYPRLTDVGSVRAGTAIGRAGTRDAPYAYDGRPYGGYYTQDDVREVVAFAKTRHVTIVPEIELPGHASAAMAAYPGLGGGGGTYAVQRDWGVFPEVFAPTEGTFAFLEDVLDEVIALFPGEYVHIGGDEVMKDAWRASGPTQAFMRREGLADEDALQSYFVQRVERHVNSRGRRIIGWDEILEGGLAADATVMSWRGTEGGIAAARLGHDVIMTPGTHLYFDYYQSDSTRRATDPVNGSDRYTTVEKVYGYEPIPEELTAAEARHILGAQANVWTEYMPTFRRVQHQTLPRMTALSEVVWSAPERRDWADFRGRLQGMRARWEVLGWAYAPYTFETE